MLVPARSVLRKAASSARATVSIRLRSVEQLRVLLRPWCSMHHVDELGGDRVGGAEQPHVADGAAHDAAQHVAAALVAGGDAVADQHHGGAHVVGDDAQRHVGVVVGAVA